MDARAGALLAAIAGAVPLLDTIWAFAGRFENRMARLSLSHGPYAGLCRGRSFLCTVSERANADAAIRFFSVESEVEFAPA